MRTASPPTVLPFLTSLRFFAAILIVLHHFAFRAQGAAAHQTALNSTLDGGFVAVSFFFILSGFILTYTSLSRSSSGEVPKRAYYANRVARIYPLYLLALVPAAIPTLRAALKSIGPADTLGWAVTKVTMTQGWFPAFTRGWNDPTWSLSAEAFFYALFPWILAPLAKIPTKTLWPLVVLGLILSTGIQFGLHNDFPTPDAMRYWVRQPAVRVPEFLVGILLARIYMETDIPSRLAQALLPLGILVGGLLLATYRLIGIPANAALIVPMAVIVLGAAYGRKGFLATPQIILLGEASYGLYLLHEPIHTILLKTHLHLESGIGLALLLATVTAVSILVHLYFEVPMRNLLRTRLAGSRPVQAGSGR